MPNKRSRRSNPFAKIVVIAMALLAALSMILLGFTAAPARAATLPVAQVSTKLFDATPAVPIPADSYSTKTVDFNWDGISYAYLSSNPDGTGAISVNDKMGLTVNGKSWEFSFTHDPSIAPTPQNFNLMDFLFKGPNHITVQLKDTLGNVGNTPIYFVVGPAGNSVKAPYALPGTGGSTTPPPPPSTKPPGYECGTVKFFGLRGSGEKNFEGEGMGETVDSLKNYVAQSVPGLKFDAVDYPAIGVDPFNINYYGNYLSSKGEGTNSLLKELRDFYKFCPHTYAIVAGYSQGADAVADALAMTDESRIAAVVLFGDPLFNPKQKVIDRGDYSDKLQGIYTLANFGIEDPRTFNGNWKSKIQSFCASGDPVCNMSTFNIASCPQPDIDKWICAHVKYVQHGWTKLAAIDVVSNLKHHPKL